MLTFKSLTGITVRLFPWCPLVLLLLATGSCVSDGDRLVVEDIRQASLLNEQDAQQLAADSTDSAVSAYLEQIKLRSVDTRKGAETLQKNLVGLPPYHHTYSAEQAQEHRALSDRTAQARRDLPLEFLRGLGALSGWDIGGIVALITLLLGGVKAYTVKSKQQAEANQEADTAVQSVAIALEAVTDIKKKNSAIQQMKTLQQGLGVRDGIKRRIRKT